MQEELQTLSDNHTWNVVPCLDEAKLICKWVYTIKHLSGGTIERYEAHLVAFGNFQEYVLDYEETFAIVAKMTFVRTIIAIVVLKVGLFKRWM